jgi:hypothetical protein
MIRAPRAVSGAVLVALASVAGAQTPVSNSGYTVRPVVGMSEAAYRAVALGPMRAGLRNLIMAQEMYWTANHRYTGDVGALAAYAPMTGVQVDIGHATTDGWTARATFPGAPGRSCVIWAGPVPTVDRPATDDERKTFPEAEVSCDGDGYTQQSEWASAAQSYMTYALRSLEHAQEKYRALNGTYAHDGSALDPFVWDRGVTVTILTASPSAWSARATFGTATGRTCVLWRGDLAQADVPHTSLKDKPGVRDEVVCDGL